MRPEDASQTAGISDRAALNRYEKIMASYANETGGLSSAMAQASVQVRTEVQGSEDERTPILTQVACGVAAPMLTAFVLWILQRAHALGIKTLFFIARDGQILSEIARRLSRQLGLPIEINYLYGSRQAWLIPSLTSVTRERLLSIFPHHDVDHISPAVLFSRLNIALEEVAPLLASLELDHARWNQALTPARKLALLDRILTREDVKGLISRKAEEARDLMLAYLRQEGVCSGDKTGFVDLGSGATLYHALASVLTAIDQPIPHGFYAGMRVIPETTLTYPEPYFFDYRTGEGIEGVTGLITFLEAVCSADHASITGYATEGNNVVPTFSTSSSVEDVAQWGFPTVRERMYAFADHLNLDPSAIDRPCDLRPLVRSLHTVFWTRPTPQEATVWGGFPMEDGWGSNTFSLILSRPYRFGDLLKSCRNEQAYRELIHRHWWHGAALATTSPGLRILIRIICKFAGAYCCAKRLVKSNSKGRAA